MTALQIQVVIDLSPAAAAAINTLASVFAAAEVIDRAKETSAPVTRAPRSPRVKEPPVEETKPAAPEAPTTEANPPEAPPAAPATKASSGATIEQVRAAIMALAKRDREQARGLLKEFGADSVSLLAPEHYAAVLQRAQT